MSGHLSSLALDEASAGLQLQPEMTTHLESCSECVAKVEALKAQNARLLASPHSSAVRNRLVGRHAASAAPSRRWVVPVLSALAAGVLLFVFVPRPSPNEDRLKGNAAVSIVRAGEKISRATVGEKVGLELSSGGASHAAVFAMEGGEVVTLWPLGARHMKELGQPGIVVLPDAFEVTKGSVTVHAAFADEPIPLDELQAELRSGNTGGRARWAKTTLEVP